MAWTEECKIAFKNNADHQIWTQPGRKNITGVLKKLSKESGIPYNTLRRWYYDKEKEKEKHLNSIINDTVQEVVENKEENDKNPENPDLPICIKCKENPVEIQKRTGKPVGQESMYYGLCGSCRKKAKIITDAIALATEEENGEWVICPECRHHFLIPNKEENL